MCWLRPTASRVRLRAAHRDLRTAGRLPPAATSGERLAAAERLLRDQLPRLMTGASPAMVGGMVFLTLARTLLGALATEAEMQMVLRGLPDDHHRGNDPGPRRPRRAGSHDAGGAAHGPGDAARTTRGGLPAGRLPALLQRGLTGFLARYGHRSVSELDVGMPRWAEDPTYVLSMLAGFLPLRDPARDARRTVPARRPGSRSAGAHAHRRGHAVQGRLRGMLVSFCLRRARALGGQREVPRFCLALLLARVRVLLQPVGQDLVRAGRLEQADDVFFLTFPEVHTAMTGTDLQATVRVRAGRRLSANFRAAMCRLCCSPTAPNLLPRRRAPRGGQTCCEAHRPRRGPSRRPRG